MTRATLPGLLLAAAALVAHADPPPGPLDVDRALAAGHAAIGSRPDDRAFTDTDGRRVTLAGFRGRPLVVSFVYTACAQSCPTSTRFLARAVREAQSVVGRDAFRVVSIGFVPEADTPVAMRVFAKRYGIDDPHWSFLSPDPGAPRALARDFGFEYVPAGGGYEHLTQVTILDAEGRIRAQVYGDAFELPMLVQPLRDLALGRPVDTRSVASIVDRARLLCTVYDPATGRYRLDWRLFIELAVGLGVLGATAGFLLREARRARRPC